MTINPHDMTEKEENLFYPQACFQNWDLNWPLFFDIFNKIPKNQEVWLPKIGYCLLVYFVLYLAAFAASFSQAYGPTTGCHRSNQPSYGTLASKEKVQVTAKPQSVIIDIICEEISNETASLISTETSHEKSTKKLTEKLSEAIEHGGDIIIKENEKTTVATYGDFRFYKDFQKSGPVANENVAEVNATAKKSEKATVKTSATVVLKKNNKKNVNLVTKTSTEKPLKKGWFSKRFNWVKKFTFKGVLSGPLLKNGLTEPASGWTSVGWSYESGVLRRIANGTFKIQADSIKTISQPLKEFTDSDKFYKKFDVVQDNFIMKSINLDHLAQSNANHYEHILKMLKLSLCGDLFKHNDMGLANFILLEATSITEVLDTMTEYKRSNRGFVQTMPISLQEKAALLALEPESNYQATSPEVESSLLTSKGDSTILNLKPKSKIEHVFQIGRTFHKNWALELNIVKALGFDIKDLPKEYAELQRSVPAKKIVRISEQLHQNNLVQGQEIRTFLDRVQSTWTQFMMNCLERIPNWWFRPDFRPELIDTSETPLIPQTARFQFYFQPSFSLSYTKILHSSKVGTFSGETKAGTDLQLKSGFLKTGGTFEKGVVKTGVEMKIDMARTDGHDRLPKTSWATRVWTSVENMKISIVYFKNWMIQIEIEN